MSRPKADPGAEEEAQAWISLLTRADFSAGFASTLKDGAVLCDVANSIRRGAVPIVYRGPQPFRQMENIGNFVRAVKEMGVPEADVFDTAALYDAKDIPQVVVCVLALKNIAGDGWRVPHGAGLPSSKPSAKRPEADGDEDDDEVDVKRLSFTPKPPRWQRSQGSAAVPLFTGGFLQRSRAAGAKPAPIMHESNRGAFAQVRHRQGSGSSLGSTVKRVSMRAASALLRRLSFGSKKLSRDERQLDVDDASTVPSESLSKPGPVTPAPDMRSLHSDSDSDSMSQRHVPISSKPPPVARRPSIAVWLQGGKDRARRTVRQLRTMFEASSSSARQRQAAAQTRKNKEPLHAAPPTLYAAHTAFR